MRLVAMFLLVASQAAAQVRPIPIPDSLAPGAIGHRGHVSGPVLVAASADGRQLVSAETEGNVIVWNQATATPRGILDFDVTISALAVSPDGRRYAVAGWAGRGQGPTFKMEQTVRVLDIESQRPAFTFEAAVRSLTFSPDGRILVGELESSGISKTPGGLVAWDLLSGTEAGRTLTSVDGYATILGFSRDGQELIAQMCCQPGAIVRLPATLTGAPRVVRALADYAALDLHAASDRIASALAGSLSLLNAATGEVVASLEGRSQRVKSVAFSADGRFLVAYEPDGPTEWPNNQLVIWDVESRRAVHVLPIARVSDLLATPSGIWIGLSDGTMQLLDPGAGSVSRVVNAERTVERRPIFYSRPDGSGETTNWRLTSVGPVLRDTAPPEKLPAVRGAGDREYWTIDIELENDGWIPVSLSSPSAVAIRDGRPSVGSVLLMRRKGDEGYPLVYLVPKGGGSTSFSVNMAQGGKGQSFSIGLTLKPHERARVGLVFVVPKKAKEADLGLHFLAEGLIAIRPASLP